MVAFNQLLDLRQANSQSSSVLARRAMVGLSEHLEDTFQLILLNTRLRNDYIEALRLRHRKNFGR
ncbi:hypothetical protein KMT30_48665, partial [Streptomyces sp. IBSBF 2953]|nr:hypothetical protein [Streptomyces hayashii]